MEQDPKVIHLTVEQLNNLIGHGTTHQQIGVTQEQLDATRRELSEQIDRNRSELKNDIKEVGERLSGEIKEVSERLGGEIKEVSERLGGEIKEVSERLGGEIKSVQGQSTKLMYWILGILVVGLSSLMAFMATIYNVVPKVTG